MKTRCIVKFGNYDPSVFTISKSQNEWNKDAGFEVYFGNFGTFKIFETSDFEAVVSVYTA